MYYNFLTVLSTVIAGGDSAPVPVESAQQVTEGATNGGSSFFGGFGATGIIIYIVLLGALYFFLIRPQKKREREMKQMQAALSVGDNIITSSGLYGTISGVGEDCFIVEFGVNKGVRIPIRKLDIIGKKTPVTNGKESNE